MKMDSHLARRPANFQPLTPLDFFERSISVFAERRAVQWRGKTWSYREIGAVARRFARFLLAQGIKPGDVVSMLSANRPEMLVAHFAVPMTGAVLNTINIRLEAKEIAYILKHSGAAMLIADPASRALGEAAAERAGVKLFVLSDDAHSTDAAGLLSVLEGEDASAVDYRRFVMDEWQPISLNYTSGTTGDPKGVIYTHRGAYLNALGNLVTLGFDQGSAYLWVLPMFHCNGWCHVWAVTAAGGLHICLDRVDPAEIFKTIQDFEVTHLACAPVVLYMLANHPDRRGIASGGRRLLVATGGAAPTPTLLREMEALGFELIHLYGLTESYGPATMQRLDKEEVEDDTARKAERLARQGQRHVTAGPVGVVDSQGREVPWDGGSMGEIVLQGNTLMAGYHRDSAATDQAFRDGVFHTGDLAVRHGNGDIELRDRAKDIVISGGENISSLEIERTLHRHPAVLMAAVVARPDPKWGEAPCAFIELKPGLHLDEDELRQFCRGELASFKVPRSFIFGELPKTATGKIQKFQLRARVLLDEDKE